MKKTLALICLFALLFALLGGCKKESTPVFATDAEQFKYEYESVNGKLDESGMESRMLDIPIDTPIVYASYSDILKYMEQGDSFAVYFGFAECPWCRSCLQAILESAIECSIYPLYYVDVHTSRDTFEIKNRKAVKTKDGDECYDLLLKKLEDVLSDYVLYDTNGDKIKVGEKRIYAPNLIIIEDGVAVKLADDGGLFANPYEDITEEMYEDMKVIYTDTFSLLKQ